MIDDPKNVVRKLFRFGAESKNFTRRNEKILARLFQKNGTTISAILAPKRGKTVSPQRSGHPSESLSLSHQYPTRERELVFDWT